MKTNVAKMMFSPLTSERITSPTELTEESCEQELPSRIYPGSLDRYATSDVASSYLLPQNSTPNSTNLFPYRLPQTSQGIENNVWHYQSSAGSSDMISWVDASSNAMTPWQPEPVQFQHSLSTQYNKSSDRDYTQLRNNQSSSLSSLLSTTGIPSLISSTSISPLLQPNSTLMPTNIIAPLPHQPSVSEFKNIVTSSTSIAPSTRSNYTTPTPRGRRQTGKSACECPRCQKIDSLGPNAAHFKAKGPHDCHVPGCGKSYAKTSHLKAHLRWHTRPERLHICQKNSCGKHFGTAEELQRHAQSHLESQRLSCKYCSRSFQKNDSLAKHLRQHEADNQKDSIDSKNMSSTNPKSEKEASNDNTDRSEMPMKTKQEAV